MLVDSAPTAVAPLSGVADKVMFVDMLFDVVAAHAVLAFNGMPVFRLAKT